MIEDREPEQDDLEEGEEVEREAYQYYKCSITCACAAHPDPLKESKSLAATKLPPRTYQPALQLVNGLSNAQMEAYVYCMQEHEEFHVTGTRKGFINGDGTGVGKGRFGAAILLANRVKRQVWFSASKDLMEDARRDLTDIGAVIDTISIKEIRPTEKIRDRFRTGIIFVTYAMLSQNKLRVDQLIEWLAGHDAN
jgi:hypothetical protein